MERMRCLERREWRVVKWVKAKQTGSFVGEPAILMVLSMSNAFFLVCSLGPIRVLTAKELEFLVSFDSINMFFIAFGWGLWWYSRQGLWQFFYCGFRMLPEKVPCRFWDGLGVIDWLKLHFHPRQEHHPSITFGCFSRAKPIWLSFQSYRIPIWKSCWYVLAQNPCGLTRYKGVDFWAEVQWFGSFGALWPHRWCGSPLEQELAKGVSWKQD